MLTAATRTRDLAGAGFGIFEVFVFQIFRATVLVENNCLHCQSTSEALDAVGGGRDFDGGAFGGLEVGRIGDILAPVVALGETFDEGEALLHEIEDVGDDQPFSDDVSWHAEGQGKAHDIPHGRLAVDEVEVMVVLEMAEVAFTHGVLKERGAGVAGDEGFVFGRDAKLPSAPEEPVSVFDEARNLAGDWAHLQRLADQFDAGRQQKTTFDGSIHVNAFFQTKQVALTEVIRCSAVIRRC